MRKSLFLSRLSLACSMIVAAAKNLSKSIIASVAQSPLPKIETSREFKFKHKPTVFSFNRVSQKKRRLYVRRLAK